MINEVVHVIGGDRPIHLSEIEPVGERCCCSCI